MSTAKDLFTNLARKVLLKDKFCFVCRTYAPENGVCKCPDLATIDSQFAKSQHTRPEMVEQFKAVIEQQNSTITHLDLLTKSQEQAIKKLKKELYGLRIHSALVKDHLTMAYLEAQATQEEV